MAFNQTIEVEIFQLALGETGEVVDWVLTLKQSEIDRYLAEVSDWEQREYFGLP